MFSGERSIPKKKGRRAEVDFGEMKVGQSYFMPFDSSRFKDMKSLRASLIGRAKKQFGDKFKVVSSVWSEAGEKGIVIWKVEK